VDDLAQGLYELLLDEAFADRLSTLDRQLIKRESLRPADVADRVALYLARQVERAVESIPEGDRVEDAVTLARGVLEALSRTFGDTRVDLPVESNHDLRAIRSWQPDGSVRDVGTPLIPLLDTTLLTNSPGEPRVSSQLLAEIDSADSIDIVMAFVRRSGLLPLMAALKTHCDRGRPLRLLTTTYTGSTQAEALEQLVDIGAEVRVSYDTATTRLHAKAWLMRRKSGFSTAYVGSSNLTHSAQSVGMEWNVRISGARNPDVLSKIGAVFESYWQSGDFLAYDRRRFDEELAQARGRDKRDVILLSPIEIRLEPFQERLLELIAVAREQGHHRNLLVSATGTGKTVMAAVDYVRLRHHLPRARLLFVAHREEILDQSLATFRHAMRDYAFGEKWVGGARPERFEHVFASIQSLRAAGLERLDPEHFDVVIVDEFHHAAAPSYEALLTHARPVELLGLTATPERADGLPILHWFDDRIAAELRLWDAIDQHRLTPFAYYGIYDDVDLRQVPWRRGQGYDVTELTNVYTSSDAWARLVVKQLAEHVDDIATMRCLGFCVSIAHAHFMARHFREQGINAVAVSGESSREERASALRGLTDGRIQAIFSVDLFNEGIDVPAVDVLLTLRPTDSATRFIQQLGRGLRLAPGKSMCTVLDFVGQHVREFRFDRRYRALLGGSRRELARAIESGFPYLPAGCHMELDRIASSVVLRNLREAIPSRWPAMVEELRGLAHAHEEVTLSEYLDETGLEASDVYANSRGWSDLCEAAGVPVDAPGPHEKRLRRAVARMQHVNDQQRTDQYRALLRRADAPTVEQLKPLEQRLARMLVASLGSEVLGRDASLQQALDLLWAHPQVRAVLSELLDVCHARIDHVHQPVRDEIPLQIHGRYTRVEILAAIGIGTGAKTPPWREGVYNADDAGIDVLAFTLDKTRGDFSPTTRYRDYAISRDLVHWESQSGTAESSPTGLRYRNHVAMGRSIYLFARENIDERSFWFLGPATYVRHQGERPMAVTWRLETPLPGDLFASFAAAVA
jgi:superfamily II DNA or RNA helicase/HKD family nuclease